MFSLHLLPNQLESIFNFKLKLLGSQLITQICLLREAYCKWIFYAIPISLPKQLEYIWNIKFKHLGSNSPLPSYVTILYFPYSSETLLYLPCHIETKMYMPCDNETLLYMSCDSESLLYVPFGMKTILFLPCDS